MKRGNRKGEGEGEGRMIQKMKQSGRGGGELRGGVGKPEISMTKTTFREQSDASWTGAASTIKSKVGSFGISSSSISTMLWSPQNSHTHNLPSRGSSSEEGEGEEEEEDPTSFLS